MSKTILIVDDSLAIQKFIKLALQKEGLETVAVDDGVSALDLAVQESPALMIVDLKLEGIQLSEFVRRLNEKGIEAPLILLLPPGEEEAPGLSYPVLKKPIETKDLIEKVRRLLPQEEPEEFCPIETQAPHTATPAASDDERIPGLPFSDRAFREAVRDAVNLLAEPLIRQAISEMLAASVKDAAEKVVPQIALQEIRKEIERLTR